METVAEAIPSARPALKWFWAAATFKSITPGKPRRRHLWERTVFLIRASDVAGARIRAERIARGKEHEYVAIAGNRVSWVFQAVDEVLELLDDSLAEGTEVYWQFFERVDRIG